MPSLYWSSGLKKTQLTAQWLDSVLLTTGTELWMGDAEAGVGTSTPLLPSLQRQSLQSACSTQLVVEGL